MVGWGAVRVDRVRCVGGPGRKIGAPASTPGEPRSVPPPRPQPSGPQAQPRPSPTSALIGQALGSRGEGGRARGGWSTGIETGRRPNGGKRKSRAAGEGRASAAREREKRALLQSQGIHINQAKMARRRGGAAGPDVDRKDLSARLGDWRSILPFPPRASTCWGRWDGLDFLSNRTDGSTQSVAWLRKSISISNAARIVRSMH